MRTGSTAITRTRAQIAAERRAHARRAVRAKATGAVLLLLSMMLVVFAVPCFAASIWDEGLTSQGGATVFAGPINDNAYQVEAPEEAVQTAEEAPASEGAAASVRAASKVNASVTETTGPGIALDDEAVTTAKKRVQAVTAATAERNAVIGAISVEQPVQQDRTLELLCGTFSLLVALLLSVVGMRSIVRARRMRAALASYSYGNALKA